VEYQPPEDETATAEAFRLERHTFAFEQREMATVSKAIRMYEVTFPSPVKTPHEVNNTVHCEYFRPADEPADGKRYPAVVVLHILGGDFDLSRLFCRAMAHKGVCALFVKMPYYGPRRDPAVNVRMISPDPEQTVQGMTQAVLDIRRAGAWLRAQEEIDGKRLGIFGISLGGITGALVATAEPRFHNVFLLLAGGDIGLATWDSKETAEVKRYWESRGGTKESLIAALRPIDPVTYGQNARGRRIAMINARFDEVIPPACTTSLWKSFGEPEIEWLDCGHYSAARFMFHALGRVTKFFAASEECK
jgi:cephalosporin-C deacetylase-like acetyl esterase